MKTVHFLRTPLSGYNGKIPFIVTELISRLRAIGAADVEGIFRLSASAVALNGMLASLDRGRTACVSECSDPILLSCALKAYFRELAEVDPLITLQLSAESAALIGSANEAQAMQQVVDQIAAMDSARRHTIAFLLLYLHEVGERSDSNKMSFANIAICFAPNILAYGGGNEQALALASNGICRHLIAEAVRIFGGAQFAPELLMTPSEVFLMTCADYDPKTVELVKRRWLARTTSLIPFAPRGWFEDTAFRRPTRECAADSC